MTDSGHIRFKDHADSTVRGNLMDFFCLYWNCSFRQALDKIASSMLYNKGIAIRKGHIKTFTRKEKDNLTKLEVVVRPWQDYDFEYWESYGVTKQWLKHADVYPISYKIISSKKSQDDKATKMVFPADKYAYVYREKKEGRLSLKVYQPFNKKGFKWCSKMDSSVIGLWTKIPEYGDRVVLCSSLKDSLCLSCQMHIPALCLQGEGYGMSDTAIKELKRRYKKIYILFDNDKAGLRYGRKLAEKTGFTNLVLPAFEGGKDISDLYKSNKDNFNKIMNCLFNQDYTGH